MIQAEIPEGVTAAEAKDFAQDALETWGGQRHPDDPLFHSMKAPKSKMKLHTRPRAWQILVGTT